MVKFVKKFRSLDFVQISPAYGKIFIKELQIVFQTSRGEAGGGARGLEAIQSLAHPPAPK